ncbi:MAG TPA: hydroxyacylglutathione hydrolase [Desulfarculaceae bacterium]|nr:hydroxyacylglutathione hydrolase [Desulfarculaceae bacterium]
MTIEILTLKVLNDNYAYLLLDKTTDQAAVIDPGSAGPVIKALNNKNLNLSHILLTHHHYDHSGGVRELKKLYPEAKIAIHEADAAHLTTKCDLKLADGDIITFANVAIKIIHLPCHTRGHVAFQVGEALFTGDTLFNAGCGKFFEGTAAEMLSNLRRLKTLPEMTRIYCGHEYTVENLEYAHQADPDNPEISNRLDASRTAQTTNSPLVPSTLSLELQTNPFLRLNDEQLQLELKTDNELDTLTSLYKIYYGDTP